MNKNELKKLRKYELIERCFSLEKMRDDFFDRYEESKKEIIALQLSYAMLGYKMDKDIYNKISNNL